MTKLGAGETPTKQGGAETLGTVLIVDDEASVRASLEAILELDFKVVAAPSIREAKSMLRAAVSRGQRMDVVVTDFELQDGKGTDFLEQAGRDFPDVVGILLTGHTEHPEVIAAQRQWERHEVLFKPVEPGRLCLTVRMGVARARMRRATSRLAKAFGAGAG